MQLTGKQKRSLRGLAHSLKPVVHVGREGLNGGAASEIENALDHHELIKVRLGGDRDERKAAIASIEEQVKCGVAGTVGAIVVLYRPHPDSARRQVRV